MSEAARWRLDIAYDGSGFSGWARQSGLRTVQAELETWIARVLRLAEPVRLVCAGRTDSGVHARGQVAHLDLDASTRVDPDALTRRLNRVLPSDLVVHRICAAPVGFDARFSAIWRRYVYRLSDAGLPPDPLYRSQVTALRWPLDVDRLNGSAADLLGLRDFGAFCKRRDGGTTIRTLLQLDAARLTDGPMRGVIECTVRADAFCHSMVRALVGALTVVAAGRRDPAWLNEVTERAVRAAGVPVLPPGGLTLEEVGYPAEDLLAARAREARTRREPAGPVSEESEQPHYFTAQPGGDERRRTTTAVVWGRELRLLTANGVFAADGLDRGTAVLLRESPIPSGSPRVLDLGCGYGAIALAIATHCPGATVDAVDVNERALALCRDNAAALGLSDRVRTLLPDLADPTVAYDQIWSNPPIRIGKQALHALLLRWLPRLAPGGEARLVVSKNLGADTLQGWLVDQGYVCDRAASAKGFRVLRVRPSDARLSNGVRRRALLSPSSPTPPA